MGGIVDYIHRKLYFLKKFLISSSSLTSKMLIKYISCDNKYNIVYGYHFRMLEELSFGVETPVHQIFSIPYSLMQSLMESSNRVKKGHSQPLAHHGLIRILIEDILLNPKIPITRTVFNDLPTKDDIRTLIYGVSPSISMEEAKQEEEDTKLDRDEVCFSLRNQFPSCREIVLKTLINIIHCNLLFIVFLNEGLGKLGLRLLIHI